MHASTHKIAVFGAGSIGCYLGGQLASAGAAVRFIGRERYQQQLASKGLTLTHYARETLRIDPDTILFDTDSSDIFESRIVLVTVKSQDTADAGKELAKSLNPDALIISFQNGVGNAARLREAMPGFTVLGAVVPFNVTNTGAGKFHCGTEGDLCIEFSAVDVLATLCSYFEKSGQGCFLSNDIVAVQWGKLLVNLNNALNTLSGTNLYTGLIQRDYRLALALMIEEALSVVQRAGIKPQKFGKASPEKMIRILRLPNFLYRFIMNRIIKIDVNARSSMLDDLEVGRASEIDYLQGEIVSLARKTGHQAPVNERVLKRVHQAFDQGASPNLTGSEILELVQSDESLTVM